MKNEYPKEMHHPNFKPAVLSGGPAMDKPGGAGQGRAAQFPPVVVGGPDDEAWHASRGYVVGHVTHPEPQPLRHKERENIRMRQGPEPEVPETYEYPKYVGGKIAKSAEEEAAILAEMNKPPVVVLRQNYDVADSDRAAPGDIFDPAELAEFRAWKAARGSAVPAVKRSPLTEEQKQQRRDNLARARAVRRQNLEAKAAADIGPVSREWLREHRSDVSIGVFDIETAKIGTTFGLYGGRRAILACEAGDAS